MSSTVRTVKVSNVSSEASEREIREFFSFSGAIEYLEVKSEDENTRAAYVTFKDSQGANTAVLLSGATIAAKTVDITLDPEYQLPPEALTQIADQQSKSEAALEKAEDVVSSMLAKGFLLGKDALAKAKALDEKHQLTSTASAKVASIDQRIGITERINMGAALVNDKAREVDQKFQVSEKTKSALAAAEQKVSSAGSSIMKNRYVFTGVSFVTGALNKVAKAAGEVGQKAQEKMEVAEGEQKEKVQDEINLSRDTEAEPNEPEPSKADSTEPAQALEPPSKPDSEPVTGVAP